MVFLIYISLVLGLDKILLCLVALPLEGIINEMIIRYFVEDSKIRAKATEFNIGKGFKGPRYVSHNFSFLHCKHSVRNEIAF